jgi:flagella basal body P-ring formation protein FlgA
VNRLLKIFLIVLVVLPIWLTIVAFAGTDEKLTSWKDKINAKLLSIKDRHIQISDLIAKPQDFDSNFESLPFELDLSQVRSNGISEIAVKFQSPEGALQKLVRIHAKLFIEDLVPVATRPLASGDTLQADDFRLVWKDASSFRGAPMNAKDLVGRTIRTPISSGEVIYEGRIQRAELVSRGERVRISVVSNGLRVSGVGIAEEAGSKGQTIKVINGDSRKELFGVVVDAQTVEVRL